MKTRKKQKARQKARDDRARKSVEISTAKHFSQAVTNLYRLLIDIAPREKCANDYVCIFIAREKGEGFIFRSANAKWFHISSRSSYRVSSEIWKSERSSRSNLLDFDAHSALSAALNARHYASITPGPRAKWGFHQLVCKFPRVTWSRNNGVSVRGSRVQTRVSAIGVARVELLPGVKLASHIFKIAHQKRAFEVKVRTFLSNITTVWCCIYDIVVVCMIFMKKLCFFSLFEVNGRYDKRCATRYHSVVDKLRTRSKIQSFQKTKKTLRIIKVKVINVLAKLIDSNYISL